MLKRTLVAIALLSASLATTAQTPALLPHADNTWFKDAKFGIFVHWGLYALHGTNSKGPYVSWAMEEEKIPVEVYSKYADQFNPTAFDADGWMKMVRRAGAKYMTFTSKHHEGFCMFSSALTDYDAMDRAAKRDIVGELVKAARANDVKISFYYSTLDWYQPDFKANLPKYIDEYMFGQVRELCTNYGPIDGIWFDGEWDHPSETWRAPELVNMIRTLQPNALINDRLGKGVRGITPLADFYTREQMSEIGEKTETEEKEVRPWEACLTMGIAWGYRRDDGPAKSSTELIRTLVDVVSRGGNLLLNVGPKPDGTVPEHLVARLNDIGDWLAKNGDSIYGTRKANDIAASSGKLTAKENTLYLHLESRDADTVTLAGLERPIKSARLLETGEALAVDGAAKSITLPATLPDPVVSVIVVDLGV
jgi:alpha-L-fucosidase